MHDFRSMQCQLLNDSLCPKSSGCSWETPHLIIAMKPSMHFLTTCSAKNAGCWHHLFACTWQALCWHSPAMHARASDHKEAGGFHIFHGPVSAGLGRAFQIWEAGPIRVLVLRKPVPCTCATYWKNHEIQGTGPAVHWLAGAKRSAPRDLRGLPNPLYQPARPLV